MADLPIQDSADGEPIAYQSASAGGDSFVNDNQVVIKATGPASGYTLIFHNGRECQFGAHPDLRVDVDPGQVTVEVDRLRPFRFNDASGRTRVTYEPSAVGIQLAAVRYSSHMRDEVTS